MLYCSCQRRLFKLSNRLDNLKKTLYTDSRKGDSMLKRFAIFAVYVPIVVAFIVFACDVVKQLG